MDGNGSEETRVRFGTKHPWQTLPVELAELLLIEWRRTDAGKVQFGKVLAKVINEDVD